MDVQLDQFKVGDVLRVVGELEELIIQKIWLTTQEPYRWVDYETQSRRSRRRVIVGVEYDDGEWETVMYDQFPTAHEIVNAEHLPATVEWNGVRFQREEQGRCSVRLVSDDGPTLPCTYADYAGSGNDVLSVELFEAEGTAGAAEVEVFVGRSLVPSDVELYLPVDTAPRTSLLRSTGTTARSSIRTGQPSITQRQVVIVAVVLAIVVLFAIMALS
jgi:hypothetical protein